MSASETRGRRCRIERAFPGFAEFIIGPAEGRTRWLNPDYGLDRFPLLLPPLAVRVDPVGLLPRRLIVIGGAGIIAIAVGGVFIVVIVVVVAVGGIGIIAVINNIIGTVASGDVTSVLDVPDHRQDVALCPGVAAGGALELAAQDGLDDRHRLGMAVLHHDGRAVGLVQRQFVKASGRRPSRPSARIAGLTL
ncbi:MAG TPA: hypothetical protein VKC66_15100, partial [Xanthobacteraceae bacterium]|nr:hypothetical protein [Xanthobacteraceae bacterium]